VKIVGEIKVYTAISVIVSSYKSHKICGNPLHLLYSSDFMNLEKENSQLIQIVASSIQPLNARLKWNTAVSGLKPEIKS
jgi:hypothetical protein